MHRLTLVLTAIISFQVAAAQDYSLESPNSANRINIYLEDDITYEVIHNDRTILERSPISITIGGVNLGQRPRPRKSRRSTVNETINPIIKVKRAEIVNHYNELEIPFSGRYSLTFRAYNEGVAYRFSTKLRGMVTVDEEQVSYHFPDDKQAAFQLADGFFTHYERPTDVMKISELHDTIFSCLPVLVFADDQVKVAITEADLYDYPGFYLERGHEPGELVATFPRYPKSYHIPTDRDVIPAEREAYLARTRGSRTFPWRMMAISDNDGELLQNEMVYKLSRPLQIEDPSWIEPGMVAWDWYNANNIYGVDFKSGINTATYKYYIDFAAQYGLKYIILDEGWYDIKTNDLINPVADIDMPELIEYGNERHVDIILWVTWKALEDNFNQALDQFAQWGIAGIKVDFMQRDDQWMVSYYEKVARAAASRQLLVDFHGSYKPSGLRRAYPNVITREGVRGLEQNKWEGQYANPENDLVIPFTRMLAGPVDYTPGAMINAQKDNHRPVFDRPMSLGTRCHQLAMYVVYESPLQMLADAPSHYLREPECMEFLSRVPTVWDQTEILEARFSDYIALARKQGDTWYLGCMTDWQPRELELDLSFLDSGSYQIKIYQDGPNAERYASDFQLVEKTISSGDKLPIHLASGGGWVAIISKNTK